VSAGHVRDRLESFPGEDLNLAALALSVKKYAAHKK
jgi:hypothetical protein